MQTIEAAGPPSEQRPSAAVSTRYDQISSQGGNGRPINSHTCLNCTQRKVRCDKLGPPCSPCRRTNAECIYQAPKPRKRKRKPEDDLNERVARYEHLLKVHNLLPGSDDQAAARPQAERRRSLTPTVAEDEVPRHGITIVSNEKTRLLDSTIWKTLRTLSTDGLTPSVDGEDEGSNGQYSPSTGAPVTGVFFEHFSAGFLIGGSPYQDLVELHPTYETAMALWNAFVECVDPIAKVCHRPTTLAMLQRTAVNPSSSSKSDECLLFAIYHFAVGTLSEDECIRLFGQTRALQQWRYCTTLRQALVNANFLKTTDIVVLQAYVLFLLAVRPTYNVDLFWILTGVAVRLGQRLGLHKDDAERGLNPFDVQMRRRLFWQLLPLDGLAGQLCGTGADVVPGSWDARPPLNVDDADIWPGMEKPPTERNAATDMIFCLTRVELGRFYNLINPKNGNWSGSSPEDMASKLLEAERIITEVESAIETKYLRYCDLLNSLHVLTLTMARAGITAYRLRLKLPRVKSHIIPDKDKTVLYDLALRMLDYDIFVHTNPALQKYTWHVKTTFLWDALIWVLSEIRAAPQAIDAQATWVKIDQLYACHPQLQELKRALPVAVSKLMLKAWDEMSAEQKAMLVEPACVGLLRAAFHMRSRLHRRKQGESSVQSSAAGSDRYQVAAASNGDAERDHGLDESSGTMEDLDTTAFDWDFWDRLIKDPDALEYRPESLGSGQGDSGVDTPVPW